MPDICIWNRCNSRCIMCTNPVGFGEKGKSQVYTFERLISRAKTFKEDWKRSQENLNFTGGEPTIHPDFLKILKWFRDEFPKNRIVLATNGRMFSYPWFVKECLKVNNLTVEIAILGYDASMHDGITRAKGSFNQTIVGIDNILKYRNSSQQLEIRIILIKQNYKHLGRILNLIKESFSLIDRVVIVFPELEGICGKNFKIVGITYKEVERLLSEVMNEWKTQFREIRLYHFPLCTLPPNLWKYTWRTQRAGEVTFLSRCDKCLYKKYCLGIHKDYLKIVGDREFKPVEKKIFIQERDNFYHPIIEISEIKKN